MCRALCAKTIEAREEEGERKRKIVAIRTNKKIQRLMPPDTSGGYDEGAAMFNYNAIGVNNYFS